MEKFKEHLDTLLVATARQGASDLHLAVGRKPTIRLDGKLIALEQEQIVTPEIAEGLVRALLSAQQFERFQHEKELDFSFSHPGDNARFRANVFFQRGYMAAALRLIAGKFAPSKS